MQYNIVSGPSREEINNQWSPYIPFVRSFVWAIPRNEKQWRGKKPIKRRLPLPEACKITKRFVSGFHPILIRDRFLHSSGLSPLLIIEISEHSAMGWSSLNALNEYETQIVAWNCLLEDTHLLARERFLER